jgi:hypothetical protein
MLVDAAGNRMKLSRRVEGFENTHATHELQKIIE